MNDEFPIDPALQSLEVRVSALRPKLPGREVDDLLYHCAFAAGQKVAAGRTRRWQIASAAMAALFIAVSIAVVSERGRVARRELATRDTVSTGQLQTSDRDPRPVPRVVRVPLDAWQVHADTTATFETALTRFNRIDRDARSLAVGTMMRATGTVP